MGVTKFQLSDHARRRLQQRQLPLEWIELAMQEPDRVEADRLDPELMHHLKVIPEREGRVLRIVYNQVTVPPRIVSAYFDRGMRGLL